MNTAMKALREADIPPFRDDQVDEPTRLDRHLDAFEAYRAREETADRGRCTCMYTSWGANAGTSAFEMWTDREPDPGCPIHAATYEADYDELYAENLSD